MDIDQIKALNPRNKLVLSFQVLHISQRSNVTLFMVRSFVQNNLLFIFENKCVKAGAQKTE